MSMRLRITILLLSLFFLGDVCEAQAQRRFGRRWRRRPESNALPAEITRDVKATLGKTAPDFTLKSADGKRTETLSSFRGDRPVALVFGSYT
jgi:hypothetical protein